MLLNTMATWTICNPYAVGVVPRPLPFQLLPADRRARIGLSGTHVLSSIHSPLPGAGCRTGIALIQR
ncbi:hypothetical protein [Streptomyces avermitilis]|uniref:hypothetical protein n=1 Tax=Streptomyces avermitilis TaxID=33903 RepID=UPI0033A8A024